MIQISPATASPAPAAPRAAPVAAAGVSGFAVALATVVVPGATAEAGETLLPGRQALAVDGKKLPGLDEKLGDGEADKDAEDDADSPDAALPGSRRLSLPSRSAPASRRPASPIRAR